MKANLKEIVSIVLAVVLLLCMLPLPYGAFVLVRLLTTIICGYLAYDFYQKGDTVRCVVAAVVAIVFQPFAKITFGREIWQVIDVIVALMLFGSVIWDRVKNMSVSTPIPDIKMVQEHGYDVFISYSTKDYMTPGTKGSPNVILDLQAALDEAGITYWIDKQGLSGGVVYPQEIAKQIYNCKVFVFLSSKNSNESTWTMNEIATAQSYGKTIIPVRVDNSQFAPAIMIYVAGLQHVNYYLDPQLGKQQLVQTVWEKLLNSRVS